jgi:hypothetical protein
MDLHNFVGHFLQLAKIAVDEWSSYYMSLHFSRFLNLENTEGATNWPIGVVPFM